MMSYRLVVSPIDNSSSYDNGTLRMGYRQAEPDIGQKLDDP